MSGAFQCTTATVFDPVTVLRFALKMFSCDVKCLHEQLALIDTNYWYSHKSLDRNTWCSRWRIVFYLLWNLVCFYKKKPNFGKAVISYKRMKKLQENGLITDKDPNLSVWYTIRFVSSCPCFSWTKEPTASCCEIRKTHLTLS